MRSLSVETHRGGTAVAAFAATRATALSLRPVAGIGQEAFTSIEALPFGAAVGISHLDVRRGDTTMRFTLLGRLAPDGSVGLLQRVAHGALST